LIKVIIASEKVTLKPSDCTLSEWWRPVRLLWEFVSLEQQRVCTCRRSDIQVSASL